MTNENIYIILNKLFDLVLQLPKLEEFEPEFRILNNLGYFWNDSTEKEVIFWGE